MTAAASIGLPLRDKPPMHVAWCGGVSRSSSGAAAVGPRVEVPAELARCLGLGDGCRVALQPLLDAGAGRPPIAESVQVEPAAESDWEVLEVNAGHVEDVMLQQVGVGMGGISTSHLW